ncbi:MAG: DNA primase [Sphingobacteriales bacterium]|nr:DNA primase [Sphingobacteriales bacterium]
MILKESIDRIMDASQIEEVVGDFVNLKKRGSSLLGLCPFHNEKTPSFNVSSAKGIYKCFGCGKAGNSVNFIMEHEKLTYPEALRYLAKKYNIDIVEDEISTDEDKEAAHKRESLMLVADWAKKVFVENLWENEMGQAIGLSYFKERGFREDIIKKFELGYSLSEWSTLTDRAEKEGFQKAFLLETGLSIFNETKNSVYDRFRNRVMFPIHSVSGRVIAFGGRILKTEPNSPKYVNSPESEIYHKSNVLYGLYFAKKAIRDLDNCYLVEGYTDVVSLHQSGIENVVASSGTSLTVEQIKLISRFSKNITILYDGDPAGIKASLRGIDMILEEGLNVKVVLFPDGHDPDSYVREVGSTKFTEYVDVAKKDFIVFKTDLLLKDVKNDPIKKADLIKDILESISKIPDQIKASLFVKECSSLLEMEERILLSELNKIKVKKIKKENNQEDLSVHTPEEDIIKEQPRVDHNNANQEKEIIRILMLYANIDYKDEDQGVDTTVAQHILSEIENASINFLNEPYVSMLDLFKKSIESNFIPDEKFFTQHPDASISGTAAELLSTQYVLSEKWKDFDIHIPKEDTIVKKVVDNAMAHLILKKMMTVLMEIQNQLKEVSDEVMQMELLQLYQQTKAQVSFLEKKLGVVVMK